MSQFTLEVYIDDHQVNTDEFRSCETLAQVVAEVDARLGREGRVLIRCTCDGCDVSDSTAEELTARPATGCIRISSALPGDLIVEGVTDAFEVLPDLEKRAVETAQVFRQGRHSDGLTKMGEIVGLLSWLATIINGLHLGYRIVATGDLAEQHRVCSERLLAVVNEMVGAQERRDWVALADCLEFELTDCIQQILAVLAKLQGKTQ